MGKEKREKREEREGLRVRNKHVIAILTNYNHKTALQYFSALDSHFGFHPLKGKGGVDD
jgi:hypothetical protein